MSKNSVRATTEDKRSAYANVKKSVVYCWGAAETMCAGKTAQWSGF